MVYEVSHGTTCKVRPWQGDKSANRERPPQEQTETEARLIKTHFNAADANF